jgi:hypothetical protein
MINRVVLVWRRSRHDELLRTALTESRARFELERAGDSIDRYRREHHDYQQALASIRAQLPIDLAATMVERDDLPHTLFRDSDVIIVCGPDGLFVNLAQYLGDQPVITINPDPTTVAGVLMLHAPAAVQSMLADVLAGRHCVERLPLACASLDGRPVLWGINDIFLGRPDQVSARYQISFTGHSEAQSSSGVIVATGIGSSGWMQAVRSQLHGMLGAAALHALPPLPAPSEAELAFVVREPFVSPATHATIVAGRVTQRQPLLLRSEMPTDGCLFSDGVVERAVRWPAGSTVTVSLGERRIARVVVATHR